ncbi:MAG: hypothetical protein ACI9UU_001049, partial [Candidatus Azotimanducaceae bacterium]
PNTRNVRAENVVQKMRMEHRIAWAPKQPISNADDVEPMK